MGNRQDGNEPLRHLLAKIRAGLNTAVLGDILDEMGHRRQFLPPQIQPLVPEMVLAGFAMPVHEIDTATPDKPFGLMFEALDSLGQDEIYLAGGGSMTYAFWGEMMTTVAMNKDAAGVVLHGYIRDTLKIKAFGLPVFSCGSYAQDQRGRGRVIAYREPIKIGEALIRPGDIVVGDVDGVICVPAAAAEECVTRALGKMATEAKVLDDLTKGLDSSAAFKKYGVM